MTKKKYDEDLENIFNGKYNYSKYEVEQKEERKKSLNELEEERNSRNSLLKISQNKLQEDLNKKNINGRVFGKHIEAESAPSRNELKVGNKFAESENDNTSSLKTRPYDKNALLKDVESVKKVRQYGNNEEEQSLIKDVKKKWSDRAYAISDYETAKAIQDEENMNPVSRLGYSLYSGGKSLFKSFVRGDLQTEDGITLDSYNDAINSKMGQRSKVYQIPSELGKEVVKSGLNKVVPGLGTALYTTDIMQRTYNDAKKEGYSDNSAILYGLLVGGMDYALNKIGTDVSTRFAKGGVSLDTKQTILENLVDKGLKKVIKNKAMENIATSFVSNGLEEWSQEYIQDFLKYYSLDVLDKGASATPLDFIKSEKESDVNQRAIESFIVGGFVGGIGGGFGELNLTKQQRNTQQAIYDYERQTGHELSNANQNTIAMIAKTYQENVKRTPNSKEILDTFKNIRQSQIDTFQKPALEMFTDLDEKHRTEYNNLVNDVSQIIYDTGINVKFDPNQQTVINSENGTIILNPTLTDMPIKNVLLHEISKQTADNDTKNYILNKLKKDGVYETYKNELLATGEFDEANVDSEIVAQELDAIFQNENEIKELAQKDKGLFNSIKDTFNTLTGKLTNNRNTKDALYFREINDRINSLYGKGDLNDLNKISKETKNNTKYEEKPLEIDKNGATVDNKQQQLDIINKSNQAPNETNTWIRNKEDIKTFKEAYDTAKAESEDGGWENYASYPDITNEMVDKALETGKITVYSSYPIENGVFVTPSYQQALDYAGNDKSKVNSKEVNLDDIAWINLDEGQYAKVESQSKQEIEKQTVEKEKKKKILSPTEIANLKPEDANMTPELQKKKYNKKGDGESKQVETLLKSNLFTDEQKQRIIKDEEFRKYDKITNKESLDKAFEKLKNGGQSETLRWFNNKENADAIDMAEGAILMKMYADNGMNDQMVEVAKKFRDMKTKTGQALQASSILSRMTPEGMVAYAQSELTEAYNELVKTKSKEWVDENKDKFDLTTSDVDFIMDTMEKVSKMEDGYEKKVELAKIQKLMSDKIPPTISKSIKGFMRISMLFNPKTQVRNVLGNTLIAPVNLVGDIASSVADKAIAKKTGVRTTGTADIKSMLKGFKKGAYEATNDFKLGINTKDMNGNKFEIGEGKSFSDKYAIGRGLNKVEHLLNYTMDIGDRVFYESWFENSLANQMALNKVDTPTQEMIDIATTEALQRTWNDNNKYTKFVLDIRKGINSVLGGEDYGLGDVLIPFAKTPANLTKAIVDYSPVGMVNALVQGNNLKKAISRGDMTPQQQHKFVQTLGKATAGTMLYILGYALAKTGVLTGKDDEDKDTKNFMKNVLGINQYSVKIGNTSFTYDWAQPISAPFAMMTNLVNSRNKETALLESVVASLDTAGSILLEQSFLQSINEVLTDNNGVVSGLLNAVLDLPARAIPTLFKQVADLADPVQRQTFEYGKPLQTAGEKMLVKIPGASKLLSPKVNTMGEDILKYGGKNNVFNVMFNPANVNKENVNEVGQEIYNVYKSTGKKDVMPRVAPYYINKKNGEKVQLSSSQIAEFQKMEGKEIENNIKDIMKNSNYKNLSNEKKAELIKNIVNYSYNLTENKMFGIELSSSYKTVENVKEKGGDIGEYYLYKAQLGEKDSEYTKRKKLRLSNISKKTKSAIYEASVDNDNEKNTYNLYNVLKENDIGINEYLDYLSIEFKGDKDENDETIRGSKKNKIIDYLNNSNLTYVQKLLIAGRQFTLGNEEQEIVFNLINNSNLSSKEKMELLDSYNGFKVDKNGNVRW